MISKYIKSVWCINQESLETYIDNNAISLNSTIFIAKDIDEKGCKKYAITHINRLENIIRNLPSDKKCIYERIRPNSPSKFYIDFDCKNLNINKTYARTSLITAVSKLFENEYKINLNESDIVVLQAHIKTKISFHVVITHYYTLNNYQNKYLFYKLLEFIPSDLLPFMDNCVYKRNQLFRLPLCNKIGKNNHLKIITNHQFLDAVLTYFGGCKILDVKDVKDNIIPIHSTHIHKRINKDKTPLDCTPISTKLLENTIIKTNEDKVKAILSLLPKYCLDDRDEWVYTGFAVVNELGKEKGWAIFDEWSKQSNNYNQKGNKYEWNNIKVKPDIKPRTLGTLIYLVKTYNPEGYQSYNNCQITYNDTIIEKNDNKSISQWYQDLMYSNNPDIFNDIKIKNNTTKYLGENLNNILDINKSRTTILQAFCGKGKTQLCKNNLNANNDSMLFITSRQCMAKQMQKQFNAVCYLDKKDNKKTFNAKRLIVSLEQVYLCKKKDYDWVILDEIHSTLKHIHSPTMIYRNRSWNVLNYYVKNAFKVIVCDANISDIDIQWLKDQRGHKDMICIRDLKPNKQDVKVYMYYRPYKNNWNSHKTFYPQDEKVLKYMIRDINNGKRFCVCSDSKAMTDLILKLLINRTLLKKDDFAVFTGKTDNERLKDINQKCKDKIIIYSPSLLYGIDINFPYKTSYGFFHGESIDSIGIYQQISRCRKAKKYFISWHKTSNLKTDFRGITYDEVKDNIQKRINYDCEMRDGILSNMNCIKKNNNLDTDNEYTQLFIKHQVLKNKANYRKFYYVNNLLSMQGYQIIFKPIECELESTLDKKKMIGISQEWRKERLEQIKSVAYGNKRSNNDIYIPQKDRKCRIESQYNDFVTIFGFKNNNEHKIITRLLMKDGVVTIFKDWLLIKKYDKVIDLFEKERDNELLNITPIIQKKLHYIQKIETLLGVKRLDIYNIPHLNDNCIKFIEANKINLFNTFKWNHKKSTKDDIQDLIDKRKGKKFLRKMYKSFSGNILSRKRVSVNKKRVYKTVVQWNYIAFLTEIGARFDIQEHLKEYIKDLPCTLESQLGHGCETIGKYIDRLIYSTDNFLLPSIDIPEEDKNGAFT